MSYIFTYESFTHVDGLSCKKIVFSKCSSSLNFGFAGPSWLHEHYACMNISRVDCYCRGCDGSVIGNS